MPQPGCRCRTCSHRQGDWNQGWPWRTQGKPLHLPAGAHPTGKCPRQLPTAPGCHLQQSLAMPWLCPCHGANQPGGTSHIPPLATALESFRRSESHECCWGCPQPDQSHQLAHPAVNCFHDAILTLVKFHPLLTHALHKGDSLIDVHVRVGLLNCALASRRLIVSGRCHRTCSFPRTVQQKKTSPA